MMSRAYIHQRSRIVSTEELVVLCRCIILQSNIPEMNSVSREEQAVRIVMPQQVDLLLLT